MTTVALHGRPTESTLPTFSTPLSYFFNNMPKNKVLTPMKPRQPLSRNVEFVLPAVIKKTPQKKFILTKYKRPTKPSK